MSSMDYHSKIDSILCVSTKEVSVRVEVMRDYVKKNMEHYN